MQCPQVFIETHLFKENKAKTFAFIDLKLFKKE
jgi:hypothetical protein